MKAISLDTAAERHRTVPKPALCLWYLPLLFFKVAGSQPCLRTLQQAISLHLLVNVHELTSTPTQFTNRVILYSLSMVSIANQWPLANRWILEQLRSICYSIILIFFRMASLVSRADHEQIASELASCGGLHCDVAGPYLCQNVLKGMISYFYV